MPRSLAVLQQIFIPEIFVDFSLSPLTDLHLFKPLFKFVQSKGTGFKSGKKGTVLPVWKGVICPLLTH